MRLSLLRLLVASALVLCTGAVCGAQNQPSPAQTQVPENPPSSSDNPEQQPPPAAGTKPKPQFFAGTVTTVDQEHVTVSRRLVGKAPESRTFLIQAKTKLSRALKPKQRVTVRYQHRPEGDVALEIQVRQPRSTKSS